MKLYLTALAVAAAQLSAPALAQTSASTKPVAQFSTCVKPEWPKEALRHEEQGTVQLAFLIGTDGSVREIARRALHRPSLAGSGGITDSHREA